MTISRHDRDREPARPEVGPNDSHANVSPTRPGSPAFRRAALLGVLGAAFSIAPIAVGTGTANATLLVTCSQGPFGSRLEMDCRNIDYTPATVKINIWCTNGAWVGGQERMAQQSQAHFTRDCGPGAHPIVWFVEGESDGQRIRDDMDDRDDDDHHHHHHHYHDDDGRHKHKRHR